MSLNFTAKSYYILMLLLPLIFYYPISDMVLLPRQLFLTAFCALLLLLTWTSKENERIRVSIAHIAMTAYLIMALAVSLSNALVLSESLYFISRLGIIIAFSLLTTILLKNKHITLDQIIKSVIIFGVIAIVTALVDIAEKTIRGQHLFQFVSNISGGFANKNLLSSILFLCLPFFMIGCHDKRSYKIVSVLGVFFAIFILLIIRTRTTLIATIVYFAIILFFFLKNVVKRKIWWAVIIFLVASVLLFLKWTVEKTIGGLTNSQDITTKYFIRLFNGYTLKNRILFWKNSLEMFRENPMGVGLGNWQIYFPKYGLAKFDLYEIANGLHTLQRPHNDFLWVLCETGIIGFAAFFSIFIIIIYQSLSLIKNAVSKFERQRIIYLFSGVIGFMIISFFDFPMERIEHLVILMMIFSIVIYQYEVNNPSVISISLKKCWILIFIVIAVCFSFKVAHERFKSECEVFNLYKARKADNNDAILRYAGNAESNYYTIDLKTVPLKWYMGTAYFSRKQFAESETCFRQAYSLTPYSIHAINNLASCLEVNGKRKEAIDMYSKALQISPKFEEARLNLSAVYFNANNYEKAFITIDQCDLNTHDPKYKLFLPVIVKAKFYAVLRANHIELPSENGEKYTNANYFMTLYYESKKNNVIFEKHVLNSLKK